MEQIFMTNLIIEKVRHLKDISIPLSDTQIRHLILTGKNGSGKTSVLEALANYVDNAFSDRYFADRELWINNAKKQRDAAIQNGQEEGEIIRLELELDGYKKQLIKSRCGLDICFNQRLNNIPALQEKYHYILAYYRADRTFEAECPKHVEKVQLKDNYRLSEFPGNEFVKYLLDLKMTEALARNNKRVEKADEIHTWFENLEQLLKNIFADESIELSFDEDTFAFHILQQGKDPFDFNTLSSGYQAVLDIVLDVMMRMANQTQRIFDLIETHLHLELQKDIMPLLTTIFPNIQFVVTTHSPFILNSLENVVIYDLENHLLVENGMNNLPYEGIVEGYFRADRMSHTLKANFERYKYLVQKEKLSDDEISEIAKLELYLDEIPDYLAIGITTEYQRLKLEYMNREDIDG